MAQIAIDDHSRLAEYAKVETSVTMPNGLWASLRTFLLMSTNFRKDEANAWAKLAQEKKEDGSPRFPNAEGNIQFWKDMQEDIEEILRRID